MVCWLKGQAISGGKFEIDSMLITMTKRDRSLVQDCGILASSQRHELYDIKTHVASLWRSAIRENLNKSTRKTFNTTEDHSPRILSPPCTYCSKLAFTFIRQNILIVFRPLGAMAASLQIPIRARLSSQL